MRKQQQWAVRGMLSLALVAGMMSSASWAQSFQQSLVLNPGTARVLPTQAGNLVELTVVNRYPADLVFEADTGMGTMHWVVPPKSQAQLTFQSGAQGTPYRVIPPTDTVVRIGALEPSSAPVATVSPGYIVTHDLTMVDEAQAAVREDCGTESRAPVRGLW